ncbi:MAG: hypothetical protein KatS3mg121_1344 [Gammaproteobacteria bacterium]|nr:MAG: hypothetical protein KatS3mg121_1344 [Gammaproteobacteria bacterium]
MIVNEFGEVGLDGERVARGRHIELVELDGGCVCCSLAGEFEAAVGELIERVRPDAIAVETTGVAEADALLLDIEDALPQVRVDPFVVLVDADVAARFPEFGHAEASQIEAADLLVLNKCDLVDEATRIGLDARLAQRNPRAHRLQTRFARVDPDWLRPGLPPRAARRRPAPRRAPEARDHGLEAVHFSPPPLRRADFERALRRWPQAVFRAKGRLILDGRPAHFDYVAGRYRIDYEAGEAARVEPVLVCIGRDLRAQADALRAPLDVPGDHA